MAVVGLGWVAINRHIPWLLRTPGITVLGAIDHRGGRIEPARQRFPRLRYADAAGVGWMDEAEAVSIATEPPSHAALALAHLGAGRHVITEKPMAMTPAEAAEMMAAAGHARRCLAVVHNFQFARSVRRAQELLAAGDLGDLREVWGVQLSNPQRRLPSWYEQLPLGLFSDESPHLLYLLRAFLGDSIRVARATVDTQPGRATPRLVSADFAGGIAPGRIEMHFDAPLSEWQLAIVGSRRLAAIDVFRDILVVLPNDGEHRAREILRTTWSAMRDHALGVVTSGLRMVRGDLAYGNDEVFRRFAAACLSGREPRGLRAADGAAVVALQAAIGEHAS